MADEPWLTGLEERLADRHEVTVAASAASDTRAPAPDPGVEVGHWLAGLEAADEPGDVHEESPRAGGCSTPVQSRSATAWEAGPEASPTPTEGRPEMDDQLDSKEDVPPVALAGLVAQLGEMDADLIRVRVSLANSDAAFSRVVSRWHPVAVPTRLLTGGR